MSDERRLAVEMVWVITKEFTVAVPADVADDEIENILWDYDAEFLNLTHATMPCIIDSEETMTVVKRGCSDIEFQNADFEEADHG